MPVGQSSGLNVFLHIHTCTCLFLSRHFHQLLAPQETAQFVSLQKLSFLIILSIGEIFISICLTPVSVSHFIWKLGEKEVLFLSPFKHQNLSSIFLFYPHWAFFPLSYWKNEYVIQVKERALQCCCVSSFASSFLGHTRPFLGPFLLQGTELAETITSYNAPELVNPTL